MNPRPHAIGLFLSVLFGVAALATAAVTRDGSSFERAILVEGDYKHSVDWEWNYLHKHYPGRMPSEHALTQHDGRTYDKFVFGGGKVVYFDVTRFAGQIFKKNNKSLDQMMKEAGIPIEKKK